MATIGQVDTYLRVIGRLLPPEVDDKTWLLVIASCYANGLIRDINWGSSQANVLVSLVSEVYPEFVQWVEDEEINLDAFR
jgi:hypothetical protein